MAPLTPADRGMGKYGMYFAPCRSPCSPAKLAALTLAAVWIEDRGSQPGPLCFASDSRTLPGPIEGVAKVHLFQRPDLAAVWAGDYRYAALLLWHLDAFVGSSGVMRERDVDVRKALIQAAASAHRHLEQAAAPAVPAFQRNQAAQAPGRTTIVVGGYSFRQTCHFTLRIDWEPDERAWRARVSPLDPNYITFIGDERKRAKQVSRAARLQRGAHSGWQMEPLGAIHWACSNGHLPTIGGDVQLAKVYPHGLARAYGVRNPLDSSVSVRGTRIGLRAARELHGRGLVVDLSAWSLKGAYFRPGYETRAVGALSESRELAAEDDPP